MKKIYFSISLLMASLTIQAQQTIGFEGIILDAESYYNGASGTGGFIETGVVFENEYNEYPTFTTWNGFSVSNITDNTTAGLSNQYSAITGEGSDNSSNYGVYYSSGQVLFTGVGVFLNSVQVTNTTYSALSMRDGDDFAKQFGSVNDASGSPDGTNGEDFFRLYIFALDANSEKIDSVEVYLADYRFTDNSEDFILDTWKTVDLSVITEPVFGLSFSLESSDNASWGMNTPNYFALDNLVIDKSVGIEEKVLEKVSVYPNPMQNQLTIKGDAGLIELFDATGNLIQSQNHNFISVLDVENLALGYYILKLSNEHGSYSTKLIK